MQALIRTSWSIPEPPPGPRKEPESESAGGLVGHLALSNAAKAWAPGAQARS